MSLNYHLFKMCFFNFGKNLIIMYEASFTGVVRTILIIMLVYYGVKILFRLFFPLFIKYILKKAESNMQQQFNRQYNFNQNQTKQEPEPTKTKTNNKVGEYIDYEEIE